MEVPSSSRADVADRRCESARATGSAPSPPTPWSERHGRPAWARKDAGRAPGYQERPTGRPPAGAVRRDRPAAGPDPATPWRVLPFPCPGCPADSTEEAFFRSTRWRLVDAEPVDAAYSWRAASNMRACRDAAQAARASVQHGNQDLRPPKVDAGTGSPAVPGPLPGRRKQTRVRLGRTPPFAGGGPRDQLVTPLNFDGRPRGPVADERTQPSPRAGAQCGMPPNPVPVRGAPQRGSEARTDGNGHGRMCRTAAWRPASGPAPGTASTRPGQ